eukprot:1161711-Pelagomonas_calceolata.AAC.6
MHAAKLSGVPTHGVSLANCERAARPWASSLQTAMSQASVPSAAMSHAVLEPEATDTSLLSAAMRRASSLFAPVFIASNLSSQATRLRIKAHCNLVILSPTLSLLPGAVLGTVADTDLHGCHHSSGQSQRFTAPSVKAIVLAV